MVQRRASGCAIVRGVSYLLTLAASLARPEEAFHHCDLVQPAQNEKRDRQADHEISTAQAVEFRPRDAAANEIDRKRNAQNSENENDKAERVCDDRLVKMEPGGVGERCIQMDIVE